MRLLQIDDGGRLSLVQREGSNIPPYCILSHTWGSDNEEVTYQDVIRNDYKEKPGYRKIRFCGTQGARDGLRYFWVDSCCIDKSSSQELTEAINSMFRWYKEAGKCYVYLEDVLSYTVDEGSDMWTRAFKQSRWFTRGWTLQELIAPSSVEFFSAREERLGDKRSLEMAIHQVTGIAIDALRGTPLNSFHVEHRMAWAANRQTKREEDAAYSLLGIFDVHMPLIYSEGKENAMNRLKREIANADRRHSMEPSSYKVQVRQGAQPVSTVPFGKDPDFVDRPELLAWIHQKCGSTGNRAALFGLGGVGKSQVAIHYCHEIRALSPQTWVFWVHAGTPARFEQGYRRIAEATRMDDWDNPRTNILSLVRNWLCNESNGSWVMIIDNADDASVFFPSAGNSTQQAEPLYEFIPYSRNGSVLFTSRSQDVAYRLTGNYSAIAEVSPMDGTDSLVLFQRKVKSTSDRADVIELIHALDFMPLAITQAAAYISQRAPRMKVARYLAEIRRNNHTSTQILQKDVGDSRRDGKALNSILKTWQISFEHIRREVPTAANLLSLMSLFDRQGILESLLIDKYRILREDTLEFEEDVHVLLNYSLIKTNHDGTEFEMHRLVQHSMKKWLEMNETMEYWKERFLTTLNHALPGGQYENWNICQKLFPHAEISLQYHPENLAFLPTWGSIMYKASWYAEKRGKYQIAEEMDRRGLEACDRALGEGHRLTFQFLDNLGRVLAKRGKYSEAEALHRLHLQRCEQYMGGTAKATLISMGILAMVLKDQGQYAEAESLLRRAMAGKERTLGPDHAELMSTTNNLGVLLLDMGKYDEAEGLFRRALNGNELIFGAEHPETLMNCNNLGRVLAKQGYYEKAESLYRMSLAGQEKFFELDHPLILSTMDTLASALGKQGKYKEAEELERISLQRSEKVLGLDHPFTLARLSDLGYFLSEQQQNEEAEKLQRSALEGCEKVLRPGHPLMLTSWGQLAKTLRKLEKYSEAEELTVRAVKGKTELLGAEHPNTLLNLNELALVISKQGRLGEAKEMHRRASEGLRKCLGLKHPDTVIVFKDYERSLRDLGRHREADAEARRLLIA